MHLDRINRTTLLATALLLGAGAGCDEDDAIATLRIRTSGEGAAKTGYPYDRDGVSYSFVDGWTLVFDRYLVSFGNVTVGTQDGGAEEVRTDGRYIADLKADDPVVLELELEPRRWDAFGFSVLPADASSEAVGTVQQADIDRMIAGGLTYLIEGTAAHPQRGTLRFSWPMVNPARNTNCTNGLDGTAGVVLRPNATTDAEITFHVDHLFWDTLGTELAQLRFDPLWGANKDGDDLVTLDELATQRLANLTDPTGAPLLDENGLPLVYNPGSIPLPDKNLKEFILVSGASQAHLNGLGLCSVGSL